MSLKGGNREDQKGEGLYNGSVLGLGLQTHSIYTKVLNKPVNHQLYNSFDSKANIYIQKDSFLNLDFSLVPVKDIFDFQLR